MKIRTGFVSNSSSSSFCLYGIAVDDIGSRVQNLIKNKKLSEEFLKEAVANWEKGKAEWLAANPDKKELDFWPKKPTFPDLSGEKDEDEIDEIDEIDEVDEDDEDDEDEIDNFLESFADVFGMEHHYPEGYDCHFLGRPWSSIGDDETGKEFKKSVENTLTKYFGLGLEFGTHEEAFYS
jgi:transcriptional regulator with XRE-family HTH domain